MDRKGIALDAFDKKFNCAQSSLLAFSQDVGLEREKALKIAACFGGGLRCGDVCGAVSGILMAIGMKHGTAKENDAEGKEAAYIKSLAFINKFKEKYNTILCRDILGYDFSKPEDIKAIKEKGLHETVCKETVKYAIEIAEDIICP